MLGNQHLYFKKTLGILMEPLIFILFGFLYLVAKHSCCKSKKASKQPLKKTILLMTVIIISMMQPTLINSAFQMFRCIDLGSSDLPQLYVMNDYDVICYSSDHLFWVFVVGIPAIAFCKTLFPKLTPRPCASSLRTYLHRYQQQEICHWRDYG